MASSNDTKYYDHYLQFVVVGIFYVVGLMAQLFIVTMNITDWLKGVTMTNADQTITSLGIARLAFHFISICRIFQAVFLKAIPVILDSIIIIVGYTSIFSSIWFSALLSVIFCLKICTIHNVLFLRLKVIISKKTIHLIALSVLGSFGYTSFFVIATVIEYPGNSTAAKIYNDIVIAGIVTSTMILWHIVPLFIYFLSMVLLIIPLFLHMQRMKSDENLTCRMDTYIKTIAFIIVSFMMCAAYIVFNVAVEIGVGISMLEVIIILNSLPLLHSVYLIFATTKLWNHFCKILQRGTKCFIGRGGSESELRDPVQRITQ